MTHFHDLIQLIVSEFGSKTCCDLDYALDNELDNDPDNDPENGLDSDLNDVLIHDLIYTIVKGFSLTTSIIGNSNVIIIGNSNVLTTPYIVNIEAVVGSHYLMGMKFNFLIP